MTEPISTHITATKPKKRKGLWWKIPLSILGSLIGLFILLDAITSAGETPAKTLPTCDSSTADSMVKDAIKNGPMSKVLNIEILALKDAVTTSSTDEKVECHATGFTNAGETKFNFSFQWVNKDKGQYIVHVEEAL